MTVMPRYWMHETSGVLRPAIVAYLHHEPLTRGEVAALRAYLRQWIAGPWCPGPELDDLRRRVVSLTDRTSISAWLNDANEIGIDPL